MSALLALVVAVLVASAVAVIMPGPQVGLARLEAAPPRVANGPQSRALPVLAAVSVLVAGAMLGSGAGVTWAVVGLAAGGLAWWLIERDLLRRRRIRAQHQVAEACQVMAGQLRIGQVPSVALRSAAEDTPVLAPVAAVLEVGGSVPQALRGQARRPGAEGLVAVAAAWQLAERTGAPAAALLGAVADELRTETVLRHTVATELAAARATGKMLAGLPLIGVGMAWLVGAQPAQFLIGSWPGRLAVILAVGLTVAGVVWTERLSDRACVGVDGEVSRP